MSKKILFEVPTYDVQTEDKYQMILYVLQELCNHHCNLLKQKQKVIALIKDGRFVECLQLLEKEKLNERR